MSPAAGVLMGLLLSLRSHSTVMRRWPCSVEQIVYLRCAFRSATIRCPRGFLSHVNICRQSASVLRYGTRALVRSFAQRGQYEDVYAAQASARGPVWTPINPADGRADRTQKFGGDAPMKRPAQPEEIAPAFVFLASPSCSSYIHGGNSADHWRLLRRINLRRNAGAQG
jgi:hypothetical protein